MCPLVTGAGSGSFTFEAASGVYGELQPGSYVFLDRDYADNEPAPRAPVFEHALFVCSHVMSRGAAHAVVDAGHKSHAIDPACRACGDATGRSPTAATSTASCARALAAVPTRCRRSARRSGWCRGIATRR